MSRKYFRFFADNERFLWDHIYIFAYYYYYYYVCWCCYLGQC
jgi:hypothetical protein